MKFTHLFSKFTHPFLQNYWNFTFSFQPIIYTEIYAVLLLAKLVPIYAFLACKIFGTKLRSCKIFDKFHVCPSRAAHFFTGWKGRSGAGLWICCQNTLLQLLWLGKAKKQVMLLPIEGQKTNCTKDRHFNPFDDFAMKSKIYDIVW